MTESPQGAGAQAPADDSPWKHFETIDRPGDMDAWIILRHLGDKTLVLYESKKAEPIIVKRQKNGDYYCPENGLGYLRNGTIVNTRIHEAVSPDDWPSPAEITSSVLSVPYPVDVLPLVAKAAVIEYQAVGQQPLSMVASSMIAHMALAVQPHADVARNDYLISPTSLYCLIQADSGERKTAIDKTFGKVFRDWQAKERDRLYPEHQRSQAMHKKWLAQVDGVKKRITALAGKARKSDENELDNLSDDLIDLQQNPVIVVPLPKLFFEDATPAAFAYALGAGYPSAGTFSNEGGLFIGGHGMGKETATSMLALYNALWDGSSFDPTRKQAETIELIGRRLSVCLMIQPDLFKPLIEKGGRAIGFVARFLLSAPISSMGSRPYKEPPSLWPALYDYETAILRLLNTPLPIDNSGKDRGLLMRLKPQVMRLSKPAKRAFIDYHDSVEKEMSPFGMFDEIRDVAAKSAENACRLAAVFQVFDQGKASPEVEARHMEAGIAIAYWHLCEARRLFYAIEEPIQVSDARELSTWLRDKARTLTNDSGESVMSEQGTIAVRDILRRGPNRLRDSLRRDAAIDLLVDAGHVRRCDTSRERRLHINPKLLS